MQIAIFLYSIGIFLQWSQKISFRAETFFAHHSINSEGKLNSLVKILTILPDYSALYQCLYSLMEKCFTFHFFLWWPVVIFIWSCHLHTWKNSGPALRLWEKYLYPLFAYRIKFRSPCKYTLPQKKHNFNIHIFILTLDQDHWP